MAATGVTATDAVRPTGPAATLTSPPSVTLPPREKAFTAASVLSTITYSVTSAPTWKPKPAPPVPIAEGPLHPRSATLNDTPTLLDTQLARHGSRDDQTEPALP